MTSSPSSINSNSSDGRGVRIQSQKKKMGGIRHVIRRIKSPFEHHEAPRVLEIGPPTDFRKETPMFLAHIDTLISQVYYDPAAEKDEVIADEQSPTRERCRLLPKRS